MAKDSDILHAVRDRDVTALTKLLAKSSRHRAKHGSAAKKYNVNYQDSDGMSALHQASLQGDEGCMLLLLDAGALADVKDNKGMRPLHYAAWQGLHEPVRMLLDCGAAVDESAEDGQTPLHLACQHGHLDVVCMLLKHGANPAVKNKNKRTPLDLACEFGKCKVVEYLIHSHLCDEMLLRHRSCDFADSSETTCLHLASKNGHANIVQLLLSAGVDVNWQTALGTALHEAALCGKTNVVRLLIQHGVDVNVSNSFDQTALDVVDKFTTRAGAKELKLLLHEASSSLLARAVKDYGSAYDKSILTLRAGDLVTILERRADGFWKGFLTEAGSSGEAGYFPSDCVVILATGTPEESGGSALPQLPASPGAVPFAVGAAHPSQSLYGSPGGSLQRYGAAIVGEGAAVGREARGSSSRGSAPGRRPPSLQSGQSFDENESLASGSGCGSVHLTTATRRSVRSDDGLLFVVGSGPGSGLGGDTCSSVSAGSSERLSAAAAASVDRRAAGDEYGLYEDDWESGYASCNFNPGQLLQQGTRDAEVLKTWLSQMQFDGYSYAENFLQAGYDMPTVSRMTPEDLTAIGITVPAHRRKLTAAIAQLKIHDGLPDYRPAHVLEWLQLLHLEQYYDALKNENYDSVAALTKITWEDLEDIGIKKLGHQKKIMLAVEQLKKIGKRQSCSSQSSNSSEPPAAAASSVLTSATTQRQPSCRRVADAAAPCGSTRAHHRSVSGEMVQSVEGYCAGQRAACRQLSCDSAMTRSLMLQQSYPSAVSRSSSGNSVAAAAAVPTGDYAQPRNLPFSRPDDSASVNSSEDSASSAGSCGGSGGHYCQQGTPVRRAHPPCGQALDAPPLYPGVGGGGWAAPDKRRHMSASSGGSGGGSIAGSSPPQYSTLSRQPVASGSRSGRGHRQVSAEESPYARLPSREATPPLAACVPAALRDSPFADFQSPYAHIQNGVQARSLNAAAKAAMVSPPSSDGPAPSSRHGGARPQLPLSPPPPHVGSPFDPTSDDREASVPAASALGGADDCDATSSSSECELDGQDFPPMAPPIAFNMQHMRVPRQQPRAMAQLPMVAERRLAASAVATSAAAGRTPARDAVVSEGLGSDFGATTHRRMYGGGSGQSAGISDAALTESCAGSLPFANENAGTIRQRPASSSSSTCSGGDGRLGDDWDASASPSGAAAGSSSGVGQPRRAHRMPRELVINDGPIDDARRFARPVMHVQPVVVSDQRYLSPALPALSALQRHIFEENDGDAKKELLADAADCARCSTDLDAMLDRDPDTS